MVCGGFGWFEVVCGNSSFIVSVKRPLTALSSQWLRVRNPVSKY